MRAGHKDYVVNDEALAYMRQRALSGPVVARLAEHPNRFFPDQAAWNVHLDQVGISALKVNPRSSDDRHRGRAVGQHQGA